jgi:hypothetical protein
MASRKKLEDAERMYDILYKIKDKAKKLEKEQQVVSIYKNLCFSKDVSEDEKYNALVSFIQTIPEEGLDVLCRLRDGLHFFEPLEFEKITHVLSRITRCVALSSIERLKTAVTLFNYGCIDICYTCFADMAYDSSVLIDHRGTACRYLFASGDLSNVQYAQECLIGIIETDAYPSDYRYKIIASYIAKTGLSLGMNATKVQIPYDEEFVYGLQNAFFFNEKNGVRDRILSGQHILQMECVEKKDKIEVGEKLMAIAADTTLEENVRADAADVMLRLGIDDQVGRSRDIINQIGFTATGSTPLDRIRTLYSNSQNIHDDVISECILKFIEKIQNTRLRSYQEVYQEVSDLVRSHKLVPKSRIAAFKALNRLSVDSSKFSSKGITLAEIFIHVWDQISKYNDEQRELLETRLVEELVDMGDTCSSGHAGRFVNILAPVDPAIRISFESQIIANISGRFQAAIKKLSQSDQDSIIMAYMENADAPDVLVLTNFLETFVPSLKKELYKEFVGGGYVKKKEFEEAFELGVSQISKKN